jgi:hypothetical protein
LVAREHGAEHDRHADGAGGLVDRGRGVRVAQGVDVGGVLRPQHDVRAGPAAGGHVCGELFGDPNVVVEHGAALCVEVQAQPRDVALHRGDGDGPDGSGRDGRDERGDRAGQQRRQAERGGYQRPRVSPRGPAGGLAQGEPGEHREERQQGRAAERGNGQQRPVRLAERDASPGEPAERSPARRASTPTHTAAPPSGAHTEERGSRDTRAIPAPAAPTNRASAADSASHGTGPT